MIHTNIDSKFHISFFSFDNCVIITTEKIGSTFLRVISNTLKRPNARISINALNLNDVTVSQPFGCDDDIYCIEYIKNEWLSMINGNFNKKIYTLFKNPFNRMLSAFVEENLKDLDYLLLNQNNKESKLLSRAWTYFESDDMHNLRIITEKYFEKNNFLDEYYLSELLEYNNPSYDNFVTYIINYFIKTNKVHNDAWNSGHNKPYLLLVYMLATKFKELNYQYSLVDTGFNNIQDIMIFEKIDISALHAGKHYKTVNNILEYLKNHFNKYPSILNEIVDCLKYEFILYDILSDKQNFKNDISNDK